MRWVAGWLLVGAAVLKAAQLVSDPASVLLSPFGQYFPPVQIGIELAIGGLLLSSRYWRALRWFVLLLFVGFAGYSFYLALNGATSCGCFGSVRVHPWWTFSLDLFVALGILASILWERRAEMDEPDSGVAPVVKHWPARHQALAVAAGIVVVSAALLFRYMGQRSAIAGGLAAVGNSVGDLVVLEPEKWIGHELPIANAIDVDVSQGKWVVLLHRHDCSVCQEQVPRYEQRADAGERVALVEVPPYGAYERHSRNCLYAQLRETHRWFVQTPVELRLQDGFIVAVQTYEH